MKIEDAVQNLLSSVDRVDDSLHEDGRKKDVALPGQNNYSDQKLILVRTLKTKADGANYATYLSSSLHGTVSDYEHFNPTIDAHSLFAALKMQNEGVEIIFDLLSKRSSKQREILKEEYLTIFNQDLVDRVAKKFCSPLDGCMIMLLHREAHLDGYILRRATKGLGTDENALRYILCSASCERIVQIREAYLKDYGSPLEKHLKSDCGGPFGDILVALCTYQRDDSSHFDPLLAQNEADFIVAHARELFDNAKAMAPILCKSSYCQLKLITEAFYNLTQKSMVTMVGSSQTDYSKTIQGIVDYALDPVHYFAQNLRSGIEKKNIEQVFRIIITRSEVDLACVLSNYYVSFKTRALNDIVAFFDKQDPIVKAILNIIGK